LGPRPRSVYATQQFPPTAIILSFQLDGGDRTILIIIVIRPRIRTVIIVDRDKSKCATGGMVALLAIATAPTEMPIEGATFRKRASVAIRTTLEARVVAYTSDPATLYQNRIDIPRPLRQNLVACNAPLYEGNITARKCQSSPLNLAMAERGQLLLTNYQGWDSCSKCCSVVGGTPNDKSPA